MPERCQEKNYKLSLPANCRSRTRAALAGDETEVGRAEGGAKYVEVVVVQDAVELAAQIEFELLPEPKAADPNTIFNR